jgi:hypothetical protein
MRAWAWVVLCAALGCGSGSNPTAETAASEQPLWWRLPFFEGTCGANPLSVLLARADRPHVVLRSPDGLSLVYQRRDGRYPHVVVDLRSGRQTELDAWPVAYSPDSARVVLWQPNNPSMLLVEVEVRTGTQLVLFSGGALQDAKQISEHAVMTWEPQGRVRAYFTDLQQWVVLTEHAKSSYPFAVSRDGSQLLIQDSRSGFVYFDAVSRVVQPLPWVHAVLVAEGRGVIGIDADERLFAWSVGRALVPLGSGLIDSLYFVNSEPKDHALVIDASRTARVWRASTGEIVWTVPQVWLGHLSADGSRLALVRPDGAGRYAVTVRGREGEQAVGTFDAPPSVTLSPDGRWLGYHVASYLPEPDTYWYRLHLWSVKRGEEVPLSPPPPETEFPVGVRFLEGGRMHAHFYEQREAVFDLASGRQLFTSSRSLVPAEGFWSYWDPAQQTLYLPQGGYNGASADLSSWRVGADAELPVATRASFAGFAGENLLVYENFDQYGSEPARLVSWDSTQGKRWTVSERADVPAPQGDGTVLFREDAQLEPDELFGLPRGRLVWADTEQQRRRTLGENVNGFVVAEGLVTYSDSSSICVVPLWLVEMMP